MYNEPEIDEFLEKRLLNLRPGERLTYHRGILTVDAEHNKALQRIRNTAWKYQSRVSLIQQKTAETRNGFNVYLYMAEGRA